MDMGAQRNLFWVLLAAIATAILMTLYYVAAVPTG